MVSDSQFMRIATVISAVVALTACGSDAGDDSATEPTVASTAAELDDDITGTLSDLELPAGTTISITDADGVELAAADITSLFCLVSSDTQRLVAEATSFDGPSFRIVSDQDLDELGRNDGGPSTLTLTERTVSDGLAAGPWTGAGEVSQGPYGATQWGAGFVGTVLVDGREVTVDVDDVSGGLSCLEDAEGFAAYDDPPPGSSDVQSDGAELEQG